MTKIAVVYASKTGNTAQTAQAICEGCQGHEIVAFGPLPWDVGETELTFVSSWTDEGTCASVVKRFLQGLYGKWTILPGMAGFGLSEMCFASLSDRFRVEASKGNQALSTWSYLGQMSPAVRVRHETRFKEKPGDARLENMFRVYDQVLSHSDRTNLTDTQAFVAAMLTK